LLFEIFLSSATTMNIL